MIGKTALALASLFLLSCAQPKYAAKDGRLDAAQKTESQILNLPSGPKIWVTWEKWPVGDELGSFIVKVGRANLADQSPVPQDIEGEIEVVLWMPSMGHGSTPVTVTKIDTGTYRATEVFFTMPGDWDIEIRRIVNGVFVEQAILPVRL